MLARMRPVVAAARAVEYKGNWTRAAAATVRKASFSLQTKLGVQAGPRQFATQMTTEGWMAA